MDSGVAFNPQQAHPASVRGVESGQLRLLSKGLSVTMKPRLWHRPCHLSSEEPASPVTPVFSKAEIGRVTIQIDLNEKQ